MGTFILGLGAGLSLYVLRGVAKGLRWAVSRLWARYAGGQRPGDNPPSPGPRAASPPVPDVNTPRVWISPAPPVPSPHYVWPGVRNNHASPEARGQRQPLGELWPGQFPGGPSHTSTPACRGTATTSPSAPWRGSGTVSLNGGTTTRSRSSWTRLAGETSSRQTPRSSATSVYHSME